MLGPSRPPAVAYLSGPMTGYHKYNYEAFNTAAERLRDSGWIVINPAENYGGFTDGPRELYLRHDIQSVLLADCVIVLPGWEESSGACLEVAIAQTIAIPVYEYDKFTPVIQRVEFVLSPEIPKEEQTAEVIPFPRGSSKVVH